MKLAGLREGTCCFTKVLAVQQKVPKLYFIQQYYIFICIYNYIIDIL